MNHTSGGSKRLGRLFIVSGPSGSGKTSLIRSLTATLPGLHVSISYTTREIRPGEQDRVDYFFVQDSTFRNMIETEQLLEHAEVFGHCYGTSRPWVEKTLAAGQDVLLEIDWQGARAVRLQRDIIGIFILPPRIDILRSRLQVRGQDSDASIHKRIGEVQEELSYCGEYDFRVVNDDFDRALAQLRGIIDKVRNGERPHESSADEPLIRRLMEEARRLR